MKITLTTCFFICFSLLSLSQQDTIISYEVRTGVVDTIIVPPNNSNATYDFTNHSTGLLPGISILETTAPIQNLYAGSSFKRIERAALHHNLDNYPARANVKIFRYDNDTLKHSCSGTLVDDNLVFTAGHCAFFQQSWKTDSLLVAPAYDDSMFHPTHPSSTVLKYYIFKSSFDGNLNSDFALLELSDNIGKELGWLSIAFNSDTSFFSNKVFHKFSYPIEAIPNDTISNVNGDTMYYNYGEIDYLSPNHYGVQSPEAYGILGQSGSSLFYSDNSMIYQCFGVMSFSSAYNHSWLSKDTFYGLKHIIDNHATDMDESNLNLGNSLSLFPNPASEMVTLKIDAPIEGAVLNVSVRDISGRLLREFNNIGNITRIELNQFSPGIYVLSVDNGSDILVTKKLVID